MAVGPGPGPGPARGAGGPAGGTGGPRGAGEAGGAGGAGGGLPGERGGGQAGCPSACGVCLEPLEGHGELARGACAHWFHRGCLEQWAKVDTSCPLCKARFATLHLSSGGEVPVEDRRQVWEDEGGYSNWDFLVCSECGGGDEPGLLLICDGCERAAHTFCVGLGREVPAGDWFCPRCTGSMPATERRERLRAMQRRRGEQAQASGAAREERVQQREAAREERVQQREAAREERVQQRELLRTIAERRQRAQERAAARAGTVARARAGALEDFRRPGAARQRDLAERSPPPDPGRRPRLRREGEPAVATEAQRWPSGGDGGRSVGRLTLAERRRALGRTRAEENPWMAFGLPAQDASSSGWGVHGLPRGASRPLQPSGRPPRGAEQPYGPSRPPRSVNRAARRGTTPTPEEAAFARKGPAPRGPARAAAASTRPVLDTDTLGTRRRASVYFDYPQGGPERPAPPEPVARDKSAAKPAPAPPAAAAGGSGRGVPPAGPTELSHEERKSLKRALAACVKKLLYAPLRGGQISNEKFKEIAKNCTRRAFQRLVEETGGDSGAAAIRKLLQADDAGGGASGAAAGAPAGLTPRCYEAVRPDIEVQLREAGAAPTPHPSEPPASQPAKKSKYF